MYGFDRTFRANLENVRALVRVNIPISENGEFDVVAQQQIVDRYERLDSIQKTLTRKLEALSDMRVVLDYSDEAN